MSEEWRIFFFGSGGVVATLFMIAVVTSTQSWIRDFFQVRRAKREQEARDNERVHDKVVQLWAWRERQEDKQKRYDERLERVERKVLNGKPNQ